MEKEKIERINELAKKKKTVGLTAEETADEIVKAFCAEIEYEAGLKTLLVFDVKVRNEYTVFDCNLNADGIYITNSVEEFGYGSYKVSYDCIDTVGADEVEYVSYKAENFTDGSCKDCIYSADKSFEDILD